MSNAERIRELRNARGVAKGQLTRMETFVESIDEETDYYVIEARLEALPKILENFESAQEKLERIDPTELEEPAELELSERESFENRFIRIKARLQRVIKESPNNTFEPPHNSTVVDTTSELPKMDIPEFHGKYSEYTTFMEVFDTMVHDNQSRQLTNIRRLNILKNRCKGTALDLIDSLRLTNENYEVARAMLAERFDNPRRNFEECVAGMLQLEKATTARSLRALTDGIKSRISVLKRLATEQQIVDGVLIQMTMEKLDTTSRTKWEEQQASSKEIPTWSQFEAFLERRCTVWEAIVINKPQVRPPRPIEPVKKTYMVKNATSSCLLCGQGCKSLLECRDFNKLTPKKRFFKAKELKLCYCCLNPAHENPCEAFPCVHCNRNHHTSLHYGKTIHNNANNNAQVQNNDTADTAQPQEASTSLRTMAVKSGTENNIVNVNKEKRVLANTNYCFLATAVILVRNNMNEYVPLRVLFDGASQASFITSNAAKVLGLPTMKTHIEITGVHGSSRVLRKAMRLQFKAVSSEFSGELYVPINQFFHDTHPTQAIDRNKWEIPKNITLADPSFNIPAPVDILLNAHLTYEWQSVGQIKLGKGLPLLQKTLLGWVVVGNYGKIPPIDTHSLTITTLDSLDQLLPKFWTLEEVNINENVSLTPEEQACEQHYIENVRRKPDGRFVVKLPFRMDPINLGNSLKAAHNRFNSLRNKLARDNSLREQYVEFMDEYRQLGHCVPEKESGSGYVIPHFHVVNPDSTTTKLRVVFDASAPSSNGLSLNDILMVGPTIQPEVFAHLIGFRCQPIALTGDISKMYRQVDVADEDQKWQKIIWHNSDNIEVLQLTTLTYGTASAAFLATRVLKQLADDETDLLAGASAVRGNMYVDDLLAGAESPADTINLYNEVTAILAKGQLPIRKFCSNSAEVMAAIPTELHGSTLKVGDKDVIKALGLLWDPKTDALTFHHESLNKPATKRGIISVVSSIFDPLGIAAPTTILGKALIQRLWTLGINWDESVPQAEETLWVKLREEFRHLCNVSLPRYVLPNSKHLKITLHGFGDASKTAYGAVFYIRAEDERQNVIVRILCAKARVAPLKTVSLPRLELLSGQLLAKMYERIKPLLPFPIHETFLWLDASIALTWIKGSPHRWTSFVATRVTRIQNWTPDVNWRHVPTDQNPADIASRGMLPSKLAECSLWFNGPSFLLRSPEEWPNKFQKPTSVPEVAPPIKVFTVRVEEDDLVTQSKFHSWKALHRVFGYVNRFVSRCKTKVQQRKANAPPPYINRRNDTDRKPKPSGVGCQTPGEYPKSLNHNKDTLKFPSKHRHDLLLDSDELDAGLKMAVKIVQQHHFKHLLLALASSSNLPKKLKELVKLHPFLDDEGLIRVGGRLAHSLDLSFCNKYPLLLPFDHPLTRSLFIHTHHSFMHAGPQAMLAAVYQRFWPLKAKVMANQVLRRCLRCQWLRPTPATQLMGQLPHCRVSVAEKPFTSTGVDFFEPLWIAQPGRARKSLRAYVCLFICMATRAVHMELVDDLSTPGFLNAFQRFVSRRGTPAEMHSDNGRNFIGARNLLYGNEKLDKSKLWSAAYDWCRANAIRWTFIPPRTPHQGGLWEAAVKSAKFHIIRAIGQASLYRAEMETVLTTVEAILNSRPLIPVSPHPEDGSPITPGHFLIGSPIRTLPEPYLAEHNIATLERYKRVAAIKQMFWQKWSREYLHTLMNRFKWKEEQPNLKVGDYVLLVDKNAKPLTWSWGKIKDVKQAADGKIRSATVTTTSGTYERGITELCPLPFDDSK